MTISVQNFFQVEVKRTSNLMNKSDNYLKKKICRILTFYYQKLKKIKRQNAFRVTILAN